MRVGNEVGLDNVLALAKRAGIASPMREFPATFLGSSEITLSELALAYTGFPNGGWRPSAPFVLTKIEDSDGEVLFQAKHASRVRIVDEAPGLSGPCDAWRTTSKTGPASRFGLKPMAAGGKSGTAYNFHRRPVCGLQLRGDLRGLDRLRQAVAHLPGRVREPTRACPSGRK